MRRLTIIAGALALCAVSCGGSAANPCAGVTGNCTPFASGTSESTIAAGFAQAQSGQTLAFAAGTFKFTNTLTLQQKNVTIKGAGIDKTVLDFSGQKAGSDGVLVLDGSDGITLVDFTVKDTLANATKVVGSTGVHYQRVKTIWTAASSFTHGAYGLYPVQSTNVLIEDCVVQGASDAGIYVGQSKTIIVKNNSVTQSVAGIEIENSFNADVTGNTSTDNTAGILVFDLPGLQQQGGHNIRIFNNTINANNRTNFAAAGDIVGVVPAGTGFFVMANHDVEVFGNTISNNGTGGAAVISYYVSQLPINDPNYYPFPQRISIHDNTFTNNGKSVDQATALGGVFYRAYGNNAATELYDGIVDPHATGGTAGNPMQICWKNNGTVSFANMHFDQCNSTCSNLNAVTTTDVTAYTCDLPALPAVTMP